jgi:hypothetical protein
MRAHDLDLDGQTRPAETAFSTAVPCVLLIRMRPLVQVQPGPQITPVTTGNADYCVVAAWRPDLRPGAPLAVDSGGQGHGRADE